MDKQAFYHWVRGGVTVDLTGPRLPSTAIIGRIGLHSERGRMLLRVACCRRSHGCLGELVGIQS